MESSAPKVEKDCELEALKTGAGNFVLALLRFCGSLALVATLFITGAPFLSFLYDRLDVWVSVLIIAATHAFSAVYFTWHYRGKPCCLMSSGRS